jgi:hypothetical protein
MIHRVYFISNEMISRDRTLLVYNNKEGAEATENN